jgi:polyphenol oxidase
MRVATTAKPEATKRARRQSERPSEEPSKNSSIEVRAKQPRPSSLQVLQADGLKRVAWLAHGFSTRSGGVTACYQGRSLNLGYTKEDSRDCVQENRRRFLTALGAATPDKPWPLITTRQIHSDVIHVVRGAEPGQLIGDGIITNLPGIAIAILAADCLPVLLVDRERRVVGAFHAGWRGTAKRIVEKGVGLMRHEFGSRPQDIHAAIGPGIQKCCYEVGEELKNEFDSQFAYARDLFHEVRDSDPVREKYPLLFLNGRPPGHGDLCVKLHLDLREANRRQLLAAGVPPKQIKAFTDCTACNTKMFFSHRAERGHTGRMMAVAGIVP